MLLSTCGVIGVSKPTHRYRNTRERMGESKMFIYVNTWKIQELLTFSLYEHTRSIPFKKENVIFMIVKTSFLRNKSDKGAKVNLDQNDRVFAVLFISLLSLCARPVYSVLLNLFIAI